MWYDDINHPTLARLIMDNLQTVYIKLRNDADFKEAFQKNPRQALKEANIELSVDELQKILDHVKESDDGPLGGRINK